MSRNIFVSTSIPYVNAKPHIGHALEFVQADVISRYFRLQGDDTFFLTGTDENSLKNVRAALEAGISTQELCNRNSDAFQALVPALNLANNDFIRRHAAMRCWLLPNRDCVISVSPAAVNGLVIGEFRYQGMPAR